MFLMFVIIASSVIYGRVYCGYMCPQMIFSEASTWLESWLKRKVNKHYGRMTAPRKKILAGGAFYTIVGAACVVLAFMFIWYFVEPRDLLARLAALDVHTAGGIGGATVTLITFLDFTLVRQKFCTSVCPYGYLQGLLGDKNTLLVHYRDEKRECIQCKKCVRVCEMGIDIRDSPLQIECIHCGECIDACVDIMARFGTRGPDPLHLGRIRQNRRKPRRPGIASSASATPSAWWCSLVTAIYLGGLLHGPLDAAQCSGADCARSHHSLSRGRRRHRSYNEFRVKIANRRHEPDQVRARRSMACPAAVSC